MRLTHMKPSRILLYAITIITSLIFIYPLLYTVITSFKSNQEIFQNYFGLPKVWHFENYLNAIVKGKMGQFFLNSVFVCGIYVVFGLFFSTMAAFILSRIRSKITSAILTFFVAGMMIPIHSILVPLSQMAVNLKLSDTFGFLISIYIAGGVPFMIFVMSGFMKSIPGELEEAAQIDGASVWQVYWHVILPLSKPVIATMGILGLLSSWNDLILALIFIKGEAHKTLSLGLMNFTGLYSTDFAGLCAAIVITSIPMIVIYILMQEKVEKGLTAGAVKE